MNANNNNFSLIRNSEINRIGPQFISPMFFDRYKVNDKMKELDSFEKEQYEVMSETIRCFNRLF